MTNKLIQKFLIANDELLMGICGKMHDNFITN